MQSPKSAEPKLSKWVRVWMLGTLALMVLATVAFFVLSRSSVTPYGTYGTRLAGERAAYDFSLSDHNNQPRQLADFKGKAVYIFFGFLNCPDVCPTTMLELKKVYEVLTPREQQRVQVLLITTDPERDTAALMKKYMTYFNPSFLGLTGSPEQIRQAASGYGVFYQKSNIKSSKDYSIDHTAATFLIDPKGQLRLIYTPDKPAQTQRMLEDLRWMLRSRG